MIRGNQIYLRAIERDDLERCHAWINDEDVTATLAQRYPYSLAQESEWLERVALRQEAEQLSFAICLAHDHRHIGNCGLFSIHAENRTATLGILIGEKTCWGHGYGTDAVRTLCRFGFEELNLHKIRLDVYAFNPRATHVYEGAGFLREGLLREELYRGGRYHDVIRMGLLRAEFSPGI